MAREINTIAFSAALMFAAARCSSPTESLPSGALRLSPPAIYETWWHEVEQCSGKTGDFAAVSWYYVPGPDNFSVGANPDIVGVWQPLHNSITLAETFWEIPLVVRHEELHAILQRTDHPPEYFVQKCGSIVAH